jgi:hypothetical protein
MWKFLQALWENPLVREALVVIAVQVLATVIVWA